MGLTDDQIRELLKWYVNSSETRAKYLNERLEEQEKNRKWINPEAIKNMPFEELKKNYLDYYNDGTGKKQKVSHTHKDIIIMNSKFRETVLFLLDESIPVDERLNNIIAGEKNIEGMNRTLSTALLSDYMPDKYCLWNKTTDKGIWALEMQELIKWVRGDKGGKVYLKVLDVFKKLKNLVPELELSYVDLDLFLCTMATTDEGKEALEKMRNGPSELKIRYFIEKTLKNHNSDKQEDIDEIRYLLEKGIPKYLENIANDSIEENIKRYKVDGVPGTRQTHSIDEFGYIPQIYIFDELTRNKDRFKKHEYYILYILREDRKGIYLSLNCGQDYSKEILKEKGEWKSWFKGNELENNIRKRVQSAKDEIGSMDQFSDIMDLGSEHATSSSIFEAASIFSKYYTLDNLPSEEELISDFNGMLGLHKLLITKNEALIAIEDPNEIKKAKEIFENRFKEIIDENISPEFRNNKIWIPKLGIWTSFNETKNYFYNPFGVGKPTPYSLTTVEINFSFTGNKVSGVFAKDSSNNIYLLHRGKLGGKFVGKQLLKENYSGEWVNVKEGDKESNLILIGALNEPNFLEKVKNFVFEVDKIKNGNGINMNFLDYLNKEGYYFEPELIENFLLSLKVKPFVILTGNSGTGKTKIAQMFAKYIDVKNPVQKTNRYEIVPVGANWTENRHIIGFYNVITDEYQRTHALDIIMESNNNGNSHEPFFLILDEMNLSHVERYFSDFLSAMESGEAICLHKNINLNDVPPEISFSDNLFVIGTVNVDETTYMFSPKVLDRSNTIEFLTPSAKGYMGGDKISSSVNGDIAYLENPLSNMEIRSAPLSKLKELFGELNTSEDKFWDLMAVELEEFQNVLKSIGFDFGFRVINEIVRFMYVSWVYEGKPDTWDNWQRYFDAQVKQKMLPRIHGSQRTLENALGELSNLCENYPTSKDKLEEMNNVLKKQRYVSFTN